MGRDILLQFILLLCIFTHSLLSYDIESIVVSRSDGAEIIGYFHKPKDCHQFPVMIVCQGSYVIKKSLQSCRPLFDKIVRNFEMLPIGILAIEKRGSFQDSFDLIEFNAHNTVTNRVNDNLTVIQTLPNLIDGWNGNLILVGGSEGTLVASALAMHLQNQAIALLLFAGVGFEPFQEAVINAIQNMPWYKRWYVRWCAGSDQDIRDQFRIMKENPTSIKMCAGQTYRYWSDMQERSLAGILDLKMPIYYMMGCKDELIESSKKLQESAQQKGNTHITFAWYDALGHEMGDLFDAVMSDAKEWLKFHKDL